MGVDTRIILKRHVKIEDIVNVLAISSNIQNNLRIENDKIVGVEGLSIEPSGFSMDCFSIYFNDILSEKRYVLFHHELLLEKNNIIGKGISPRSNPFWIALGERLINLFGGKLVYNDCSDESRFVQEGKITLKHYKTKKKKITLLLT